MRMNKQVRNVALVGMMGALISVISMLSAPTPLGFPITFQVLAVALSGYLLGQTRGAAAVFVFILIGGCGLPVFAGGRAGFGELFSATGGFLWSFPLLALMCGVGDKKERPYLWGLLGLAVNYLAGAQQLAMVTSLSAAVWLLPCFVKDVFFVTLAHRVAGRIKRGAGLR